MCVENTINYKMSRNIVAAPVKSAVQIRGSLQPSGLDDLGANKECIHHIIAAVMLLASKNLHQISKGVGFNLDDIGDTGEEMLGGRVMTPRGSSKRALSAWPLGMRPMTGLNVRCLGKPTSKWYRAML